MIHVFTRSNRKSEKEKHLCSSGGDAITGTRSDVKWLLLAKANMAAMREYRLIIIIIIHNNYLIASQRARDETIVECQQQIAQSTARTIFSADCRLLFSISFTRISNVFSFLSNKEMCSQQQQQQHHSNAINKNEFKINQIERDCVCVQNVRVSVLLSLRECVCVGKMERE